MTSHGHHVIFVRRSEDYKMTVQLPYDQPKVYVRTVPVCHIKEITG